MNGLRVVVDVITALLATALALAPAGAWTSRAAHLTVNYPAGWHVTTRSLTPITQPVERFALYAGAPPRPVAGPPRPGEVIGFVMEQTNLQPGDLRNFPARPPHFHLLRPLGGVEGFGNRWAEIVFRDHARGFYLFIGVGEGAGSQLPKLLTALDSLRVGSR